MNGPHIHRSIKKSMFFKKKQNQNQKEFVIHEQDEL